MYCLASRPLRYGAGEWELTDLPGHVVDVFFDFVYNPASDDVLFVWQTNDQVLDATLPSGPLFAMEGNATKWFAKTTGASR